MTLEMPTAEVSPISTPRPLSGKRTGAKGDATQEGAASVRVLLADDHTLLRKGLRLLIAQHPAMRVVGEAEDGRAAIDLALELKPDVVVMDLNMKNLNGVEATRQIVAQLPGIKVMALSAFGDRRNVVAALQAGASGYVLKEAAVDELIDAIQSVVAGKVFLSPRLTDTVIRECVYGSGLTNGAGTLTPREREILQLLAEGRAMKEIAKMLSISTKTVESHRRAMMEKLQLFSMAELTKHAVREGLTTLD